jgi:hypothetical protein
LSAEPADIWRDAGRSGLTSSGRGLPTAEYVEPWVTPRKHTSFIDKVNLKFASLERSEGHEEPIVVVTVEKSVTRKAVWLYVSMINSHLSQI